MTRASAGQQGSGGGARFFGDGIARHHPGDFIHPFRLAQRHHLGQGHAIGDAFLHPPVMRALGGDLRRMGDDQHLPARGKGFKAPPHRISSGTTDPAVDFVKDQRLVAILTAQADLQGQQEAAQFPARGDLIERTRRGTGIGRHGKGNIVVALRARGACAVSLSGTTSDRVMPSVTRFCTRQ